MVVGLLIAGLLAAPPNAPPPAAAVAAFRQDPATAALALARAAEAHPVVAPALNLLQAEAQLAAGARDKARVLALRAAREAPVFAVRGYFLAARAAVAAGPKDCKDALELLEKAPAHPRWAPPAARLHLKWEAEAACGRPAAEATRRELAVEWPETPEGGRAAAGLTLSPEMSLKRASALERARSYPAAERELSGLLEGPLADEARFQLGRLHLERIRTDFRLAERAFSQVAAGTSPRAVEAAYLRARALGRAGDSAAAAAAYEAFLGKHPSAPQAADARFFRAFLDYENGRWEAAATAFAAIADGTWAGPARWYRVFSLHLARAPDAPAALDALAAAESEPEAARRVRYWAARALERSAPTEARKRLLALAREDPLDWYGLLVRRRFPGVLPAVGGLPAGAARTPAVFAPKAFRTVAERVRALSAAGLHDYARPVLAEAWVPLRKAKLWPLQADLARTSEDFGRLYRGAHGMFREVLAHPPAASQAAIWRDAYPLGWRKILGRAAPEGMRPTLLAAFILKESGFDPEAVSPAHAVGLMQLMDPTARRVLEARGEEDRPVPDLFVPAENITLGGWYVGALGRRFGGQIPLVAAAYNAGPPSVLSWFRGRPRAETDLFVENIPFRETREYVKKLAELYAIYQLVHEGRNLDEAAAAVPLELDLTVREGVDF